MAITFDEYQKLAARTANDHKYEQANYAMGLTGESGELIDGYKKFLFHSHPLDNDYIKKEAGDVLWYTSQIMRYYKIHLGNVFDTFYTIKNELISSGDYRPILASASLELSKSVGKISEVILRKTKGKRLRRKTLVKLLAEVFVSLFTLVLFCGLTIEEVAEANIEKLKTRYPEGFDPEKSINRTE